MIRFSLLRENYRIALASVRTRRMRSLLTLFGVIVGVASVVTIASLGEGLKHQIAGEAHKQGGDIIVVKPGKLTSSPMSNLTNAPSGAIALTDNDVSAIGKVDGVSRIVPFSVVSAVPSYDQKTYEGAQIVGTTGNMPALTGAVVEFGAFFEPDNTSQKVAVIGPLVAEKLFGENVPVGKILKIRDQEFVVRGVLEKTSPSPLSNDSNFNNAILIPYQVGKILTGGNGQFYQVMVKVDNEGQTKQVASDITSVIQKEHGGQQDFSVIKSSDSILFASNLTTAVTSLVGAVALISLLLGGISIMNVMLVSVTERTQEIGIRKAVGATSRQIYSQFLMEAMVLSLWGAMVGVMTSVVINIVLRVTTNLQPIITWQPVVVSVFVSVAVGVIFGTAPAVKASRKDPIEALRSS